MRIKLPPVVVIAALASLAFLSGCAGFVDYGSETSLGVGARGHLPLGTFVGDDDSPAVVRRTALAGSVQTHFPSGADYAEASLEALLPLFMLGDGAARSYVGTGMHIGRLSPELEDSSTEVGLNLVGGITFVQPTLSPYFEVRGFVGGVDDLRVTAGLQFVGSLY